MKKKIKRWDHLEDQLIKQEEDKKTFNKKLEDLVYNYPTKNKEGFINEEQQVLIAMFPEMNMDKYWGAQNHITCMMDENGKFIIYHCDVLLSLRCGLENRDVTIAEWD
jgi:hypothetical protein